MVEGRGRDGARVKGAGVCVRGSGEFGGCVCVCVCVCVTLWKGLFP